MKTMKLFLLAILFTASLHAQNDTFFLDDGNMIIGTGGIKVAVEDGKIIIDGSGITEFHPVDTFTVMEWEDCDAENYDPGTGITMSCRNYHPMLEVKYVTYRNAAGVEKQERLRKPQKCDSINISNITQSSVVLPDSIEVTSGILRLSKKAANEMIINGRRVEVH